MEKCHWIETKMLNCSVECEFNMLSQASFSKPPSRSHRRVTYVQKCGLTYKIAAGSCKLENRSDTDKDRQSGMPVVLMGHRSPRRLRFVDATVTRDSRLRWHNGKAGDP
jgi:hypothetical protein